MRSFSLRSIVGCLHPVWRSSHVWSGMAAILFALGTIYPASLWAGHTQRIRLPSGGQLPVSGLSMSVDFSGVDSNGYRPVKFSIQTMPQAPSVANRTLRLELSLVREYFSQTIQTVVGYATLPAGATRAEAALSVPIFSSVRAWTLQTSEDGQVLKELSTPAASAWGGSGRDSEAIPAILIIDADAPPHDQRNQPTLAQLASTPMAAAPLLPDLRHLPNILVTNPASGSGTNLGSVPHTDSLVLQLVDTMPSVQLSPFADLPSRWLDLTCFDMTFITSADLQTLVTQHPEAWRALRNWLATGPTLCVYDMKLSVDELRKLESCLALEPGLASGSQETEHPGWRAPDVESARSDAVSALASRRESYGYGFTVETNPPGADGTSTPAPAPEPAVPESPPFLVRDVDLGRVVAIETAEPFLQTRYGLPWLLNELGSENWMWYQRHGISMLRDNEGYWNWMVPGVGAAPVGTFLLLITVFVIVIGPVNYLLLRRSRRLHLLLVTVPLGAGLVTLALFLYALIADGLDVRVRVRGVAEVDQKNGRMVSWSRQSYYAGLAPSQGLRFPASAAVYPIYASPEEHPRFQRLVWDEDQPEESGAIRYGDQRLASGYLGSRSMAQYMVVSAGPVQGGLRIDEGHCG